MDLRVKTKLFLLIPIILLLFYNCTSVRKIKREMKYKARVTTEFPEMGFDSVISMFYDTVYATQIGKYIVHELPEHVSLTNYQPEISKRDSTVRIIETLIYDSIRYQFFICDTSKSYGYNFKNWTDSIGEKKDKKNFLLHRTRLLSNNINLSEPDEKFIKSKSIITIGDEIVYKYMLSGDPIDSCKFYFSNKLKGDFSFSKKLDAAANSRLYKKVSFFKPDYTYYLKDSNYYKLELESFPVNNIKEMEFMIKKIETKEKL